MYLKTDKPRLFFLCVWQQQLCTASPGLSCIILSRAVNGSCIILSGSNAMRLISHGLLVPFCNVVICGHCLIQM